MIRAFLSRRRISTATSSRCPTRIATINMERTYWPNRAFLAFRPRRRRYSISLLRFDPDAGTFAALDEIAQALVLPEDILYDDCGENLAVAVFHRRSVLGRKSGYVDFFSIEDGAHLSG
ncbi:MAG: hypothetical protein AAGJ87_01745 [Pseudomonadota bacterium]